jgi:lipopolysaccharide assembly outer membrane protein LptD (OstA)
MLRRITQLSLIIICLSYCFPSTIFATTWKSFADTLASDSLSQNIAADSAMVDSALTDSLAETEKGAQLEGPIIYEGDIVTVSRIQNKIYLQGNAKIVYQVLTLEAEYITIDQNNQTLFAEGAADTVDSLGNVEYVGLPVFQEKGQEPIRGNTIFYDFNTKRGKIGYGKTKMPPGYYKGDNIHKISKNTLLVEDGYFTSCEYIDDPHFYFRSNKMRVEVNEKVVARPVYLYIADVPLFVIPWGVFPNKKGRHSGLLIPSYGESSYGGRFLKNMGYYWAPNDYIDATFTTDYYDKLGFTYGADLSYVMRYILNGQVSGFYFPKDPNRPELRNRWAVQFRHTHNIDPTLRLAANGKFQSDGDLAQDYASDYRRRTDQLLTSNLTLSKKWIGTKNSMQLSLSRTENLQTEEVSYTAPNLRFTRSQSSLYETFTGKTARGKKKWYETINFSYNGQLVNKGRKDLQSDSTFVEDDERGIEHRLGFNSPQKIFSYLNISPSINYEEIWVDETTQAVYDDSGNVILDGSGKPVEQMVKGFDTRRMFNASIGLNTTMFGLFEPNIGNLKFIRHKTDPRISFQFSPNFGDPSWGYYNEVTDTSGTTHRIDKFKNTPFRSTPTRGETQKMNINWNNLFQAKLVDGDKETKLDLFRLDFSTSYNFLADEFNWSDLRTNFRSTPIRGVNLSVTSTHSFYERDSTGRGRVDELRSPRLTRLNANLGFSLDQNIFASKGEDEETDEGKTVEEGSSEEGVEEEGLVKTDYLRSEDRSDEFAAKKINIPWRVNLGFNYSMDRNDINNIREQFNIKATANISVTKNWKLNWTATYDAIEKELVYQSISIYRNLHCWEMSFNWQPTIDYYSFRINVKADILQDLKLTKHPSGTGKNIGY